MTGRLLAGGGGLDLATACLALRDQVVPGAVHLANDRFPELLDLVLGEPRPAKLRAALVLARGYDGSNAAVVVRAV